MNFTIERNRWNRGTTTLFLLDERGCMCAMGFRALAAGYSEDVLRKHSTPQSLPNAIGWLPGYIAEVPRAVPGGSRLFIAALNSDVCMHIIQINDNIHLSDSEREGKLTNKFGKLGDSVTFV